MHQTSPQRQILNTNNYNYLLFLPKSYEAQEFRLPMILFLHGAGERGSNLEDVKRNGIARIVEEQPDFPFIAVSPQCPPGERWSVNLLSALLDDVIAQYHVSLDRVYLTGLSMGGYGTWHLAADQPDRFAAIAPICGGGNPQEAYRLKNLPVWAFHGKRDRIVPLRESEKMVQALKNCGANNVKFTVYPEADHDSWTQTYNNPMLYDWFLQHQRSITT
ncbi:prolyl oligopeptidase family serine peptidase [Scytonema sp. PCC 10023]|uniref:carboxylesterase family protein n=1 Tax=Scytonema sp. PCC 10023 TaxID=1680591 RepID=UPI0039C5CA57